jgi:hypothetical protein
LNKVHVFLPPWKYGGKLFLWPEKFCIAGHKQKHYKQVMPVVVGTETEVLSNIQEDAGVE